MKHLIAKDNRSSRDGSVVRVFWCDEKGWVEDSDIATRYDTQPTTEEPIFTIEVPS
jgi:hypothetical protein